MNTRDYEEMIRAFSEITETTKGGKSSYKPTWQKSYWDITTKELYNNNDFETGNDYIVELI